MGKLIDTIFFDRDGVINEIVMRGDLIASPRLLEEFRLRADFCSFYQSISSSKLNLFVISNQPDLARGLLSQESLDEMSKVLVKEAAFREIVYCVHDNQHGCACRKPKPGMLLYLLKKYGLSPDTALMVGDSPADILAGKAAGLATALLLGCYNAAEDCSSDVQISSLHDLEAHFEFRR